MLAFPQSYFHPHSFPVNPRALKTTPTFVLNPNAYMNIWSTKLIQIEIVITPLDWRNCIEFTNNTHSSQVQKVQMS